MYETYSLELADKLIAKWKDLVIGKQTTFMGQNITYVQLVKCGVENNLYEVKVIDNNGVQFDLNDVVYKTDLINFIDNPPV